MILVFVRYPENRKGYYPYSEELNGGKRIAHNKNSRKNGNYRCEIRKDKRSSGGDMVKGGIYQKEGANGRNHRKIKNGNPEQRFGKRLEHQG